MILFIKYPFTEYGLSYFKCGKYIQANKIKKHVGFITVYPKHEVAYDGKIEKVVYSVENKIGFYSKSLQWKDILQFKGGFSIEKCAKEEWQEIGKKWYKETGQKLPRKIKKKINK